MTDNSCVWNVIAQIITAGYIVYAMIGHPSFKDGSSNGCIVISGQ